MIVQIIKLLWNGNKFNYGIHFIKYKFYTSKFGWFIYKISIIEQFEDNIFEMKEYWDIFRTLRNSGFANVEYIYDFFVIIHDENKIIEILNKIFFKNIFTKIIKKNEYDWTYWKYKK